MKKLVLFLSLLMSTIVVFGQTDSIILSFTAKIGVQYQQLDSVRVINIDNGADTTLFWNDTILKIVFSVGGPTYCSVCPSLKVFNSKDQAFPNKVRYTTPCGDQGALIITDILGRRLCDLKIDKGAGEYSYNLRLGGQAIYFATVNQGLYHTTVKVLNLTRYSGNSCYLSLSDFKPIPFTNPPDTIAISSFPFKIGDSLRFEGYAVGQQDVIYDNPSTNEDYIFHFTKPLGPCHDIDTVSYGGQIYNTIEIGTQCWLRENLNIGIMIPGSQGAVNNGIIEKYCFDNDPANCITYGGLYQWGESVQYKTSPGTQGICPSGWIVPSDNDWTIMTDFLGGESIAGGKLKEIGLMHWTSPNTGATNQSGFIALPGGIRSNSGGFSSIEDIGRWWSATESSASNAYNRYMNYDNIIVNRVGSAKTSGFSVRCLMDTCLPVTTAYAGPDQSNITDDSVVLTANSPNTGETGNWNIISGAGGSINNPNSPLTFLNGNFNETYTLTWTISNGCHTSIDTVTINFAPELPGQPCPGIPTVVYGGQTYNTVQIGSQCWLKENLNIGTMINSSIGQTNNAITEKYCFNNDQINCSEYGGLYQWDELMVYDTSTGTQGICPSGWHIPNIVDVNQLDNFLGGTLISGGSLKEVGTTHWVSPNTGASNISGFTALGAGNLFPPIQFENLLVATGFWMSSSFDIIDKWQFSLSNSVASTSIHHNPKESGLSVRCMKDCSQIPTTSSAGPDQSVIGDSTNLAGNTPITGTGQWSVVSGTGGTILQPSNPTSSFTGVYGTTYGLVWTISTICSFSADTVIVTFNTPSGLPCPGIATVAYGGQTYNTVKIGTQCWFKENLNIGTLATSISGIAHSDCSNNGIIEKYCYDNNPLNCNIYGGLYDWNEMMQYSTSEGGQGICPAGWHIPSDNDWCIMTTYVDALVNCNIIGSTGINGGSKLKEAGTTHWTSPNFGATNSTGFTALGGGNRSNGGSFSTLNDWGTFYTSSQTNGSAYIRTMFYAYETIGRSYTITTLPLTVGYSVRCLKDCLNQPTSSNAGPDQTIIGTSTSLSGNTPTNGSGQWSIISGNGGSVTQPNNPTSVFTGQNNTSYTLIWTIFTVCDTSRDTVGIVLGNPIAQPCAGTPFFVYGGQTYNTVKIGNQCWMKENLNIGTMVIDDYTGITHTHCSNNGILEKYCYNNLIANCTMYGGLYDWDEIMQYDTTAGIQGICPSGWHIPTDSEWCTLTTFIDPNINCNITGWSGVNAGGKMKEVGLTHWDSPNTGATNLSGFTALGTGIRNTPGNHVLLKGTTAFWSSSEHAPTIEIDRGLVHDQADFFRGFDSKEYGFSVRCIKD